MQLDFGCALYACWGRVVGRAWEHISGIASCPPLLLSLLSSLSSSCLVLLLSSFCPFLVLLFLSSSCPPLLLSCSCRLAALANPASPCPPGVPRYPRAMVANPVSFFRCLSSLPVLLVHVVGPFITVLPGACPLLGYLHRLVWVCFHVAMKATVTQRSKCDITIGSSHDIYPVPYRSAHVTHTSGTGVFKHLLFRCSSQTAGGFRKVLAFVSTNIGIFGVDADADKNADAFWGLCWCNVLRVKPKATGTKRFDSKMSSFHFWEPDLNIHIHGRLHRKRHNIMILHKIQCV